MQESTDVDGQHCRPFSRVGTKNSAHPTPLQDARLGKTLKPKKSTSPLSEHR